MHTRFWKIDSDKAIHEAVQSIQQGEVVAFPTETVYGLGADARSNTAVEKIFRAKGRPSDNPLIVHISELNQLDELVIGCNETEQRLMERLWPGPLALVLPARPGAVSARVTAGLDTVAVRMPDHPLALRLITAAGCPIAAPSANRSGRPSPTTAEHVMVDMEGRIAGVLDGGPTGIGLESTVIQVTADGMHIHVLRPGGVTDADLREAAPWASVVEAVAMEKSSAGAEAKPGDACGSPSSSTAAASTSRAIGDAKGEDFTFLNPPSSISSASNPTIPRSPGMKYTHYAPQGRLILVHSVDQDSQRVARYIQQELDRVEALGETTGVLAFGSHASQYRADVVVVCGSPQEPAAAARGLYAALRRFDELGATYILAEAFPEEGLGQAIMNRLRKAAAEQIVIP